MYSQHSANCINIGLNIKQMIVVVNQNAKSQDTIQLH